MITIIIVYLLIPLLLSAILAFKKESKELLFLLKAISFGLVILYLVISARWELVSIYFRFIIPIIYITAVVTGYRKIEIREKPIKKINLYIGVIASSLLIVFMSAMIILAMRGYPKSNNVIDIESPLRNNKYIVLNGGGNRQINAHAKIAPQDYALDIVALNNLGLRSSKFSLITDLDDYEIYNDSVFSPINGVVIDVVNQHEDLIPPNRDTKNLTGNYVVIENNGNEVVLAHFKKGSIVVKINDIVSTNTYLGRVGNSGNTSEPHLHIHIEKGGETGKILNGNSIPFTIDGKYLKRGSIINNK